jgi:macrodomain Ter protein organizer (MatP/YcbG family)
MVKHSFSHPDDAEELIAKIFAELPPGLAKKIRVVIRANGFRHWNALNRETRRAVLHLVSMQINTDRRSARRRAEGRYTLEEAICLISSSEAAHAFALDGTKKWQTHWDLEARIYSRLVDSVKTGNLSLYRVGERVPFPPDDAAVSTWLGREAFGSDLNDWLVTNLPRVAYRFPSPECDADDAAVVETDTETGVGAPADRGDAPVTAPMPNAEVRPGAPVAQASVTAPTKRPCLQQHHQEQEILRVIRELGYDAAALPGRVNAQPWVKSYVRAKLPYTPRVLDKAWERLRKQQQIGERKK